MTSKTTFGDYRPEFSIGEYNQLHYAVSKLLNDIQTATLVKVVSCTNSGGVSPVGFVDVLPMVFMIDGAGQSIPHGECFNVPYLRIQGGANAIIIDPAVGDIGICVFASRDISKIKRVKVPSPPDSYRKFDYADGLFLGGVLNSTPTQYIQFNGSGVTIVAPTVTINGNLVVSGTITGQSSSENTFNGKIHAINGLYQGSVNFNTHVHGGVTGGSDDTGVPVG